MMGQWQCWGEQDGRYLLDGISGRQETRKGEEGKGGISGALVGTKKSQFGGCARNGKSKDCPDFAP